MGKIQVWRVTFGKNTDSKCFSGSLQNVVDKAFVKRESFFVDLAETDREEAEESGDWDITKIELIAESEE